MRLLAAYLPLVIWAVMVLGLGTLQMSSVAVPGDWDKLAHFLMYGTGGAIAAWTGRVRGAREGVLAFLFVLLTGLADELHQATLPRRNADLLDWIADAVGAGMFYLVVHRLLRRRE